MPTAQGYVAADSGVYFALQSAKGTAATAFKGAKGLTAFTMTPTIQAVDGVPMLGAGFYMEKSLGYGVQVQCTASGWVTLDTLPAFLLGTIGLKGATTGTSPYTHPYTVVSKNASKKYHSIALVRGETAAGVGIHTTILRDAVMTGLTLNIGSTSAITWDATWTALNFGPGAGTETFSYNTAYNIPNPNNAANTFTLPAMFPADRCLQNISLEWAAQVVQGDPCLGTTGEYPDILIESASWKLSGQIQGDTNAVDPFEMINYKTLTPAANTSAFTSGLTEGAFSFLVNSDNFVSGAVPYSLAASFSQLQWTNAVWSNGSPNTVNFTARSFGSTATFTVVNGSTSAAMTL